MIDAVQPQEGPIAVRRARRPMRRHRRWTSGATMAEFALIAPMGFLLIMSIVVVGIVVTNFIQVTNTARDGARMAAICAGEQTTAPDAGTIPDGSSPALTCSVTDLETYMERKLTSIPAGSVTPTIQVCPATGTCPVGSLSGSTSLASSGCNSTELIQVTMSYPQPLYLPLVGQFFETTPGTGIRTLQSKSEAGCE